MKDRPEGQSSAAVDAPETDQERALDRRILRGSAWVAVSYGGRNLISILSLLVLVRLLEPAAFGLVALAWTVLRVLEQLQGSGIGSALIFRREDVERAAASALVFAACSGVLFYAGGFFLAPLLSGFFDAPELTDVLRVMLLMAIIRGLAVVPGALLEREIDFRARAKGELLAGISYGGVALGLAFSGAGVWSLVAGHLVATAVQTAVFWMLIPWRPSPRRASWPILRDMLRYGRFVGATNIVNLANNTVDTLVVGRVLSTAAVGFYSVTYRLADFPNSVIGYIVGRVLFPVYSMVQADMATFRRVYVQNIQRIALLALPVSVALFVLAEPIVRALLGEDWLRIVTPLKILAVYGLVKSFAAPCGEVFRGAGKPQLGLMIAAAHAVVAVPLLIVLTPRYGLEGAASAMLGAMCVTTAPALYLAFRLIDLRLGLLGRALLPSLACAAALGVVLALAVEPAETMAPLPAMFLLVGLGVGVYIVATAVFARGIIVPMWVNIRGTRR